MYKHQNGQLADRGGIFVEFDKKVYWIIIADCTIKLKEIEANSDLLLIQSAT